MKRFLTLLLAISLLTNTFSQTPQKISYQAVLRGSSNALLVTTSVGIQISILQGSVTGNAAYVEKQSAVTNANGLLSIEIGGGTVLSGNLAEINWAGDSYFVKTEIDPAGGTNYTITGTSQILSVPYAMHARTADNISNFNSLQFNGIGLPYTFGPDPDYVGTEGSFIGFGHDGVSEDFVGYKNNTFYFKDSPEGGDIIDPDVVVGGKLGVGIEILDDMLEVGGDIDVHNNTIKNLADPVNAQDAATKAYVDETAGFSADGSETKVTAGTNVTVTGVGTTASPYVVNAAGAATLTIGQSYQGGIIFFLDESGQHGLIAATQDQSTGIQWYNGTIRSTGATGDGVFAGEMNTAIIIATQIADNQTGNFAAKVCADYQGGGYGDWYLPSKSELNMFYNRRAVIGGFFSANYWNSTEIGGSTGSSQHLGSGYQGVAHKADALRVRAIRAF